jgi:Flp pilus assembly protein TadB
VNFAALPAALAVGLAVAVAVYALSRPWRRLGPRVNVYTVATRSRLGQPVQMLTLTAPPSSAGGVLAGVFGPIVGALAGRLTALLGHRDEAAVALALEQAGIRDVSPRSFAYQQLTYTVLGFVGGAILGLLSGIRMAVVMALAGGSLGLLRKRQELGNRTEKRCTRMRSELLSVCNLLAIHTRVTPQLQQVLDIVITEASGEVIGELRRVRSMIDGGTPPEVALSQMANLTPEPAAAGLYRALSLAITTGGPLADTLISLTANIRDQQRDERRAAATRRTLLINMSNASLLVLPLIVLLGAGGVYTILGSL